MERYIEMNPMRAGMVEHLAEYRWSSYRNNAQGEPDSLLKPHALYLALGKDTASRAARIVNCFDTNWSPAGSMKSAVQ